jgi:hypothetical protein
MEDSTSVLLGNMSSHWFSLVFVSQQEWPLKEILYLNLSEQCYVNIKNVAVCPFNVMDIIMFSHKLSCIFRICFGI